MNRADRYDVIVIGGGPAGSTAGALVADGGGSVLLLDREEFPRFRIGESLMPATYWTLERLGVLDKMHASSFVKKHSVQFFSQGGRAATPFYFSATEPGPSSQTWQVVRADFDDMLLRNAEDKGVEVHERASVRDVLFDGERATGVRVRFADGQTREIGSSVVVDASGQTGFLARRLGLRDGDPNLRHCAFFTRFRGAARAEGIDEGATLIMHTDGGHSWFWYIPLPDDVVSVGVVGHVDHLVRGRSSNPQEVFDQEAARCPALQERIAAAERLDDVKALKDFSYASHRIAGDGWVLAGDAFGFLDPIYSTGVFLALKGAEGAADSILDALAAQDFSGARLGRHGSEFLAGMEAMRKLVYAYYSPDFNFADFLREYPECKDDLVNLLIGNVYRKNVNGLLESMDRFCELPKYRPFRIED